MFVELAEGDIDMASERYENMITVCAGCLSSLLFVPLESNNGIDGKRKVISALITETSDCIRMNNLSDLCDQHILLGVFIFNCTYVLTEI